MVTVARELNAEEMVLPRDKRMKNWDSTAWTSRLVHGCSGSGYKI